MAHSAQPCYDQSDHPLLWCEDKRRQVQRFDAAKCTSDWRLKKAAEKHQQIQEKIQYSIMVANHHPWGRPGGGAPNHSIRFKNITSMGIYPEAKNESRAIILPPWRTRTGGGGGGGAPIRSTSGHILTGFRDDPIISFSESMRNHVENDLRYKETNKNKQGYKMDLDKMVAANKKGKIKRMSVDKHHDPWGKAGPGGAPWRNPRNVGHHFMKSLGWTDKRLLQTIDAENEDHATTEGNHTEQQVPTSTDPQNSNTIELKRFKNYKPNDSKMPCCPKCCCQCMDHGPYEAEAQPKSLDSKNTKPKKYRLTKSRNCMITGGVELVPLLAKRRALQRPISLATTDVTKCQDKRWQDGGVEHLNDLVSQMAQRQQRNQIVKENEMRSCRQHFETLDTFWGRPGHGAPRQIKNKLNLNDLLYKMPVM